MSTLTKFSALPYTGPAPTNRDPFVPADVAAIDARGEALSAKIASLRQERGQDLPTFIVDKAAIVDVLRAFKDASFNLPLDLFGVDYPNRDKRFDVVYQLY